jgi:hypothetical protein
MENSMKINTLTFRLCIIYQTVFRLPQACRCVRGDACGAMPAAMPAPT